jgi:excisionase family DNA binding protein
MQILLICSNLSLAMTPHTESITTAREQPHQLTLADVGSERSHSAASVVVLDEPLLTCEDAAKLLRVKVSWVYEAVRDGRLPCIRVGRHIRFTRSLLERWLAGQVDSLDTRASALAALVAP